MRRSFAPLSFHAKLTLTIAISFIVAGTMLLVVENLLIRNVLEINTIAVDGNFAILGADDSGVYSYDGNTAMEVPAITLTNAAQTTSTEWVDSAAVVNVQNKRLNQLMIWSVIVLVVFAGLAILTASWISRRSLARIGEITRLAQQLSGSQLDRRLNLTGPEDEIKQLGDTFDGMLDRLQRVFVSQNQFIANASHELRTPLTTVRATLEIPLAQGKIPDTLRPSIERALDANARSERLIASLLVLARGRLSDPDRVTVDMATVVADVLAGCRDEAAGADVLLHPDVQEGLQVNGDPALLEQAVHNLIVNAIRHNIGGGQVWITLRRDANNVTLEVGNTGLTYDPADLDRLREPFQRHVLTRTSTGTGPRGFGLGLTIVESVVTMHGGTIGLLARPGGGLIVTVSLPSSSRL